MCGLTSACSRRRPGVVASCGQSGAAAEAASLDRQRKDEYLGWGTSDRRAVLPCLALARHCGSPKVDAASSAVPGTTTGELARTFSGGTSVPPGSVLGIQQAGPRAPGIDRGAIDRPQRRSRDRGSVIA